MVLGFLAHVEDGGMGEPDALGELLRRPRTDFLQKPPYAFSQLVDSLAALLG